MTDKIVLDKRYLGEGWDFPFRFTSSGSVSGVSHEDKIKLNIISVLSTDPGTRYMEPDFGCPLRKYMFEPEDMLTFQAIKNTIIKSLTAWVPTITIRDVLINFTDKQENFVPVVVKYVINYSNSEDNLVFPFYKPSTD